MGGAPLNAPKMVRLAPQIAAAVRERYDEQVSSHGLSWVVSWLVSYTLGLPVPETPVEGKARGGAKPKKRQRAA